MSSVCATSTAGSHHSNHTRSATEDDLAQKRDSLLAIIPRPMPPSSAPTKRMGPRTHNNVLLAQLRMKGLDACSGTACERSSEGVPEELLSIDRHLFDNGDLSMYLERQSNTLIMKNLWELYMLHKMRWSGSPLLHEPLGDDIFGKIGEFFDPTLCTKKSRRGSRSTPLDTLRHNFPASMRSAGTAPPRFTSIGFCG